MEIFKIIWKRKVSEFPYEYEHCCIVSAENKEQAKYLIFESFPYIERVKISKISTKTSGIIFYQVNEIE